MNIRSEATKVYYPEGLVFKSRSRTWIKLILSNASFCFKEISDFLGRWLMNSLFVNLNIIKDDTYFEEPSFLRWANPGLFFIYFCLFDPKISRQQDSNTDRLSRRRRRCWPLDHHHVPITFFLVLLEMAKSHMVWNGKFYRHRWGYPILVYLFAHGIKG